MSRLGLCLHRKESQPKGQTLQRDSRCGRTSTDARREHKDAAISSLMAVSRRFKDGMQAPEQLLEDTVSAVALMLDVVEGCLAYCWDQSTAAVMQLQSTPCPQAPPCARPCDTCKSTNLRLSRRLFLYSNRQRICKPLHISLALLALYACGRAEACRQGGEGLCLQRRLANLAILWNRIPGLHLHWHKCSLDSGILIPSCMSPQSRERGFCAAKVSIRI